MPLVWGVVNTRAQLGACKVSCNNKEVSLDCIILVGGVNPTLFGKTMGFLNQEMLWCRNTLRCGLCYCVCAISNGGLGCFA
jgi:hypothetical protein